MMYSKVSRLEALVHSTSCRSAVSRNHTGSILPADVSSRHRVPTQSLWGECILPCALRVNEISRSSPKQKLVGRFYDGSPCNQTRPGGSHCGKGRETPVADAATLVEIAWLLPGRAAGAFRRKGAESVCRMLGGDLSLVDEIQRRHAQIAGTAEEEFLLADTQAGSTQQVVSHKRCLDDDDEVFAARKQQVLRQISQQTIREHAQGSMGILDLLSTGNTPPATLQLLQTIRHNVTARLGSMIENGMQGMLAIEAAPQQQQQQHELSINQQAQRWTVQMYANKLGLPAAACTAAKLKAVGTAAGKIWSRERLLPTIARSSDGAMSRSWFEPGSNTAQTVAFVPEEEPHVFAEARMKYSLAYKGGYEAADSANFDTWTYPVQTGAEVLKEAFSRVVVTA